MTGSFSSLLILLIVIRSIQTQVCDFRSECGVVGGKTELFCAVTEETPLVADTNWSGPQGDLILGGLPETSNVDLRMTSYGFYLSILNTTESDVGSYTCGYLYTISSSCTLTKENLEALTCEEKVVDRRIVITITYRPYTDLPKIQVTDSDGNDINGTFNDGKHDDFLKEIVWTSDELSSSGGSYNYIVDGTCSLLMDCSGTVDIPEAPTTTSMNAPTTGTPGLEDWKIALIVSVVIIFVLVIALIVVYIVCFKNKPKGGYFAGLSSYCCFKRCYCCCSDQASTSSQVYPTPAPDQNSSPRRDVTVITVKNDTASENYYEAVSRRDVTVITVKNDTASENFPTGGQGLSLPNNKADNLGSVNTTDLSPKSNKLPPLEHPDTETVDEIQKKTKKEKNRKKRRSKSTKEENETEEPDDGELLYEVGI